MASLRRLSAAILALVVLAAGPAPIPVLADDERPDLKIEFIGIPIANNQRDVQVKITNVSIWWADETKLEIETVSPSPRNRVTMDVENLDPGQSVVLKYTLAANCNGHEVKAEVSKAKNYEGVQENKLDNNRVQTKVCQPQSEASSKPAPKPEPKTPEGPLVITDTATVRAPAVAVASGEPDLKLDPVTLYTNPAGVTNDQVVRFKVTNIGNADAPEGSGKLEFNAPAAEQDVILAIPALARNANFEGYAQLPAPCDGYIVTVAVYAPGESKFDDNKFGPVKLCPDKPEPVAAPLNLVERYPLPPEHMRPGTHAIGGDYPPLTFEASQVASYTRSRIPAPSFLSVGRLIPIYPEGPAVGWGQDQWGIVYESQTAVKFDLGQLDEVRSKIITGAVLAFDEHPEWWRETDGSQRYLDGCVSLIGTATVDWAALPEIGSLFPYEYYDDVIPRGQHEWNVLPDVTRQAAYSDDKSLRYGYVLAGSLTLDQLEGHGQSSCTSRLSNPRLIVTYVVPS